MAGYYRERIGIVDVIKDTFGLLRENFGILAVIALSGQVLTLAQNTYIFLFGAEFSTFTTIMLAAAEMFLLVWVQTALISSVASLHFGKQFSMAEMKKAVRSKYWGVFVTIIKLSLLLLGPFLLVYLFPHWVTILSVSCLLFYFGFKYLFVVQGAILGEHASNAFRESSRLMKDRFWRVAGATIAFGSILIIPLIFSSYDTAQRLINQPTWVIYLIDIATSLYGVAVLVIETTFTTLLYFRLRALEADPVPAIGGISIDKPDSENGGHHESEI